EEQPRAFARAQRLAVHRDTVGWRHVERRRRDRLAVDADAAGGDPGLRLAPRGEPRPRHHFGDAFAGFVRITFFGHEHDLWHRHRSCKSPSTRPAPRRRAARCRSAALSCATARWWRAPATVRSPTRTRP